MFKTSYLIRLDDACPTMDLHKWSKVEVVLDKYSIKPLVGIVPDCRDRNLMCCDEIEHFWERALEWQNKGWTIAMHGYEHTYTSDKGLSGLNPFWSRSEFAGHTLTHQREKVRKGIAIMHEHGFNPHYFFAPSHTFDENTLIALKKESEISIISDTIGRYPYKKDGFLFIPQITGHCVKMPVNGIYTFCFHPNTMTDVAFDNLEQFLSKYCDRFISFQELQNKQYGKKSIIDRVLSWSFFTYRKIKGLK